jgi:hypothetical protein
VPNSELEELLGFDQANVALSASAVSNVTTSSSLDISYYQEALSRRRSTDDITNDSASQYSVSSGFRDNDLSRRQSFSRDAAAAAAAADDESGTTVVADEPSAAATATTAAAVLPESNALFVEIPEPSSNDPAGASAELLSSGLRVATLSPDGERQTNTTEADANVLSPVSAAIEERLSFPAQVPDADEDTSLVPQVDPSHTHHWREAAIVDPVDPTPAPPPPPDSPPSNPPLPPRGSDPASELISEIEAAIEDSNQYQARTSSLLQKGEPDAVSSSTTPAIDRGHRGRVPSVPLTTGPSMTDPPAAVHTALSELPRETRVSSLPAQPRTTPPAEAAADSQQGRSRSSSSASPRKHQPRRASTRVDRVVAKQKQEDETMDALLSRNMPLPPAMSYLEVRNLRTPGRRAIAYATRINALAKEESGLRHWVKRTRDKGRKGVVCCTCGYVLFADQCFWNQSIRTEETRQA